MSPRSSTPGDEPGARLTVFLVLAVAFVACVSSACGRVQPVAHNDAGTDSPPGAHACVFGTDTFDNGCTFSP